MPPNHPLEETHWAARRSARADRRPYGKSFRLGGMALPVQLISYDLQRPGQNYPGLFDASQSAGKSSRHCLESVWLVKTAPASTQVRDILEPYVDANDKILVAALVGNWAILSLTQECNK
jgi:hypothetical protein